MKLMLLVLVISTFALPMLLSGPDGQPIMSLSDWIPEVSLPDQQQLSDSAGQLTSLVSSSITTSSSGADSIQSSPSLGSSFQRSISTGQMYKWQDQQGRWHFSNEKPADMANVAVEDLPEVKNVMKAPVNQGQNSSNISLPDLGNASELLERLQRSAAGNDQ